MKREMVILFDKEHEIFFQTLKHAILFSLENNHIITSEERLQAEKKLLSQKRR